MEAAHHVFTLRSRGPLDVRRKSVSVGSNIQIINCRPEWDQPCERRDDLSFTPSDVLSVMTKLTVHDTNEQKPEEMGRDIMSH